MSLIGHPFLLHAQVHDGPAPEAAAAAGSAVDAIGRKGPKKADQWGIALDAVYEMGQHGPLPHDPAAEAAMPGGAAGAPPSPLLASQQPAASSANAGKSRATAGALPASAPAGQPAAAMTVTTPRGSAKAAYAQARCPAVWFEVGPHTGRLHFHGAADGSRPLGLNAPLEARCVL